MSYIRFGWGLNHIKGQSDSYIICAEDDKGNRYIDSYGHGDLGIAELLCDAIDDHWKDDKIFADWFKKEVAKKLGVELRDRPITIDQSIAILMGELDPSTLKKITPKQKAENERLEKKEANEIERLLGSSYTRPFSSRGSLRRMTKARKPKGIIKNKGGRR